jgi:hypothetical protein
MLWKNGNIYEALEWLTRAVEILDWGKRELKDEVNPGVIFDRSFIRGIRALNLNIRVEVTFPLH